MNKIVVPILIVMAIVLAACSGRSDDMESFATGGDDAGSATAGFAMDTSASVEASGFAVKSQVESEMSADEMGSEEPRPASAPAALADRSDVATYATKDGDNSSGPIAELATQARIIVRTADMHIIVTDISGAVDSTADMAEEFGGWVVSSNRTAKHRGFVSIRIPADRLEEAIQRLRDSAVDVESEIISSRDVTDQYVDLQSRLKNQQATEEALLKLLERATKVEDALRIRETLSTIQEEVELLLGKIKLIETTAAFSLLNVSLELDAAEMTTDAGEDQAAGVGEPVRFRASFTPSEGIEDFVYTWDFGDGYGIFRSDRTVPTDDENTRETATVTHVYHDEQDSPYTVHFEITGTGDAGIAEGEDDLTVTITRIPTVEVFAGNRVTVDQGEEVELNGSFTRPVGIDDVKYRWTFGDGSDPVEGDVANGVTNVVAKHTYPNHRPFPFNARLTITAKSDAGDIENSAVVDIRVLETEGWVIGDWSLQEQLKVAVRSLSAAGQWAVTGLIWLGIFSPIIAIVLALGYLGRRRTRFGSRRRSSEATASDTSQVAAQVEES